MTKESTVRNTDQRVARVRCEGMSVYKEYCKPSLFYGSLELQ